MTSDHVLLGGDAAVERGPEPSERRTLAPADVQRLIGAWAAMPPAGARPSETEVRHALATAYAVLEVGREVSRRPQPDGRKAPIWEVSIPAAPSYPSAPPSSRVTRTARRASCACNAKGRGAGTSGPRPSAHAIAMARRPRGRGTAVALARIGALSTGCSSPRYGCVRDRRTTRRCRRRGQRSEARHHVARARELPEARTTGRWSVPVVSAGGQCRWSVPAASRGTARRSSVRHASTRLCASMR